MAGWVATNPAWRLSGHSAPGGLLPNVSAPRVRYGLPRCFRGEFGPGRLPALRLPALRLPVLRVSALRAAERRGTGGEGIDGGVVKPG